MGAAGAAPAPPRHTSSPSPHRRRSASALSPAKSNAAAAAAADARPKPKAKAVPSRYLLGPSSKSSTSTSTSTSTTTTTTTTTSSSSNSTSTSASTPSRRFASPLPRRSVSVDRPRPSASNAVAGEAGGSNAGAATTTTTRSLSVAFQGRSFSFETSKAKPATSPSPVRRPVAGSTTPERRRPSVGAAPERGSGFEGGHTQHRWPMSARLSHGFEGNPLAKSYDCSLHKRDAAVLAAVRSLRQSMVFEEGVRRSSFDGGDYLMSSDTESVSSGSNSGSQDAGIGISHRARRSSKGMSVPARFLQDAAASRSHRFADPSTPYLTHNSGLATSPRTAPAPVKKSLLNGFVSSPLNRSMRQPSPSKLIGNTSRRMSSPSRPRNSTGSSTSSWDQQRRGSSGYGWRGEVKRRWHGGSKVDCEHLLRILSNRYLQWRCVNAQADAALAAQKSTAEKDLCDAWITTLGMRKSVALKRFQLQLFRNSWKLMTVLNGQMAYLEEWSALERDYADSLSGIVEALTTTILCLPITDGAKADIQDVKNAVGSAVDIMQTIGSSICALLSKLAGTSVLVSDLAKVATEERTLMEQSRELLSSLATMHVKYCSLQGQKVQTTRKRPVHS